MDEDFEPDYSAPYDSCADYGHEFSDEDGVTTRRCVWCGDTYEA